MTDIRIDVDGAVGTITIDRPKRFNSLDVETARDLRKAGLQLARDSAVRAVVLRGSNGVFCSGADLKYIRAGGNEDLDYLLPVAGANPSPGASRHPLPRERAGDGQDALPSERAGDRQDRQGVALPSERAGDRQDRQGLALPGERAGDRQDRQGVALPSERAVDRTGLLPPGEGAPERSEGADEGSDATYGDVFKQILEYIHSTISEIRRAPKPFIAAVDGIAAAGGFGLAMSCDLVVASERASFEWAYSKTGLTGAESSTFMLPKLVGLRRAFELLFLNPRLTAGRALEIGLITAVYPDATFDDDVRKLAQQVACGPTEALGIAKELLNQAAGMDRLDFHLDRELENLARIADGRNFAEGIEAFFEKRPAHFGVK